MTSSSVMPTVTGIVSDGRGNVLLTAWDGTKMVIQRADIEFVRDRLLEIEQRFQSTPIPSITDLDKDKDGKGGGGP